MKNILGYYITCTYEHRQESIIEFNNKKYDIDIILDEYIPDQKRTWNYSRFRNVNISDLGNFNPTKNYPVTVRWIPIFVVKYNNKWNILYGHDKVKRALDSRQTSVKVARISNKILEHSLYE